jgi:hypothetical protein
MDMATSRGHQEAHGIGQIEEQLDNQIKAAAVIQGASPLDREIRTAANQQDSELDEIIEK